ncbi:MAG: hypothetical protein ACFFDT_20870 [Candidatus Hodarchaeota archaeon]
MTAVLVPHLNKKIDQNEWFRNCLQIHFDKEIGTPYWLKKQRELNINVLEEVESVDDLHKFGLFNHEDLRNIPIQDFIPKSLKKGEYQIFETGGTTGEPKRNVWSDEYWDSVFEFFCYGLKIHKIPLKGQNWLYAGPTGPHVIGKVAMDYPKRLESDFYTIDLDPRFIKVLIMHQRQDVVGMYLQHIEDQAMHQLRTQKITVLFTTSKVLELIPQKVDPTKLGLKALAHGGTSLDSDTLRVFHEEIYLDMPILGFYGNALFGCAIQDLPDTTTYNLDYYPQFPELYYEIVDFDDPWKKLSEGHTGRVLCHRFGTDFLLPNMLERDQGERIGPSENFPWKGVRNPELAKAHIEGAIEGVY